MSSTLRASVTSAAGGVNQCPNPEPTSDLSLWSTSSGGGPDTPTLTYVDAASLPQANPIDGTLGAGYVTWAGPNVGASLPASLFIPDDGNVLAGDAYTWSIYVLVPSGMPDVTLVVDGATGDSSKTLPHDTWVRLTLVGHTASVADPQAALWGDDVAMSALPAGGNGSGFYFAGALTQPGTTLNVYTNGGGQPGDPVQVLVDGADTPITANGLPGYIPSPGDRLLVARVGGQMEVIQYLSRGTVPYATGTDISNLQAQVNANSQSLSDTSTYATGVNNDLQGYKASNDLVVGGLQGGYDALTGVGQAGVQEDYIWVGDDPALQTVKSVQISTFVQAALYAGDNVTLAAALGLVDTANMGDITFPNIGGTGLEDNPPMTTFYNVFTANGLQAKPWN